MRRARRIAVLAVASLLLGASGATAGTYDVSLRLCTPEDTTPFEFVADPGLEAFADCQAGRVVAATGRGPTVPSGASAAATLTAPADTTFESIAIGGGYQRPDCRWDAGVAADGVIVIGARAFEGCDSVLDDRGGRASLDGASTISLRVACRDAAGCPTPDGRPWPEAAAAAHLHEATLTIRDDVPPSVEIFGFHDETGTGWVQGIRQLFYSAFDYAGLREISLTVADHHRRHVATCDYTRLVPCPESEEPLSLDTTRVPDGVHDTTVEVVDSGGNRSSQTMSAAVDNTPPHRVQPDVDGGSGWQRVNDFSVSWIAARERYAPIKAVHYRLCRPGTTDCVRGMESTDGVVGLNTIERLTELKVPEPGEWTIEVWREDEAGNVSEPSPPVHMRLDDAPPALAFEPRRLDDPRRVSVAVSDGVSGVAGGEIHLRAAGSGSWQSLPTRLDGGRLIAEVDDDRLPAGTYELRALARDHAGNDARTHVLPSGEAALLQLPLRERARLTAGIVRRSGKTKSRLLADAKAGFNAKVRLGGRLANEVGHPVRGAQLHVYWRPRVGRERTVGSVTTNRAGEFSYTLRARASGTLRVRYEGSRMLGSAQRELLLRVPAASVLRVNRRKVLNGGTVVFSGRLRGRPFPPLGKIIYLQAYLPDKGWSTFGEDRRADASGRWRVRWEFENTRGLVRYRFRVLVPREADYPFEEGASNIVRVTVRGR